MNSVANVKATRRQRLVGTVRVLIKIQQRRKVQMLVNYGQGKIMEMLLTVECNEQYMVFRDVSSFRDLIIIY